MRVTQLFQKLPWDGGLNDKVDPGLLDPNDLTVADNIVFATTGARIKRSAHQYFDLEMPAVTARASTGTTRTLTFAANLQTTSPTNKHLVVGEYITVSGGPAAYNGTFEITAITGADASYTASGSLTESTTATSAIAVVRADPYITINDFWWLDSGSNAKTQELFAVQKLTSDTDNGFKFFKYDQGGNRTEVPPATPSVSTSLPTSVSKTFSGTTRTLTFATSVAAILAIGQRVVITAAGTDYNGTFLLTNVSGSSITYDTGAAMTAIPVTVSKGSTGTARNIILASSVTELLEVGQQVTIANAGANYDGTVTLTSVSGSTIGWTGVGSVTEGPIADTDITITRTATAIPDTNFVVSRSVDDDFSADNAERVILTRYNNRLIISFDAVGVLPRVYNPELGTYELLQGTPPDFFTVAVHFARLLTNDKADKDRVHYSAPFDHETWQGNGDSGAVDSPPDGDPDGITTIFPNFRGQIFISKKQKTYKFVGDSPENYQIISVSEGLGSESPQATAPVDLDDILYISERGIHTLQTTSNYGDFKGAFLSDKVQNRFNAFARGYLKNSQAAYINTLNSVAFSFTPSGNTVPNQLLFYNFDKKEWYRWPDLDCRSLCTRLESGFPKLYYGTSNSRVVKTQQSDSHADFEDQAIVYRVKSGTIYPSQSPQGMVGFKKFTLFYKPKGRFQATVTITIDNYPAQALSFSQLSEGETLGEEFVLGNSVLAFSNVFAPFTQPIDGYGRGCTIEIEQAGQDEELEVYGFSIEYKPADVEQETNQTGDASDT